MRVPKVTPRGLAATCTCNGQGSLSSSAARDPQATCWAGAEVAGRAPTSTHEGLYSICFAKHALVHRGHRVSVLKEARRRAGCLNPQAASAWWMETQEQGVWSQLCCAVQRTGSDPRSCFGPLAQTGRKQEHRVYQHPPFWGGGIRGEKQGSLEMAPTCSVGKRVWMG